MPTDTELYHYNDGWDAGYTARLHNGSFALYNRPGGNSRFALGWIDGYNAAMNDRKAQGY